MSDNIRLNIKAELDKRLEEKLSVFASVNPYSFIETDIKLETLIEILEEILVGALVR